MKWAKIEGHGGRFGAHSPRGPLIRTGDRGMDDRCGARVTVCLVMEVPHVACLFAGHKTQATAATALLLKFSPIPGYKDATRSDWASLLGTRTLRTGLLALLLGARSY